jgi:hypothetical protein
MEDLDHGSHLGQCPGSTEGEAPRLSYRNDHGEPASAWIVVDEGGDVPA